MKRVATNTAIGFAIGGLSFVFWIIVFNLVVSYG